MSNTDLPHRVLIVDDELVCDTLLAVFTNSGYEARTAISAESAIEVVAQWEPHLALLDVDLPQMNGIDLAVALKERPSLLSCSAILWASAHTRSSR